jgi:lipoate-protein ligase B
MKVPDYPVRTMKTYHIEKAGRLSFDSALAMQQDERVRVLGGVSQGKIFLLEHDPPVITLGRRASKENFLIPEKDIVAAGYQVRRTGRGGDVTVHEPGQVVAYFVLPFRTKAVKDFVEWVMAGTACVMKDYLPDVIYDPHRPGLWIENRKICSVGFDLTGGVSMHGIAINVANSLRGFALVAPCGMRDVIMTSLSREVNHAVHVGEIIDALAAAYSM